MRVENILKHVDHTLLSVTATSGDYIELCDEGMKYGVASVCVPPSRVFECAEYVRKTGGKLPICTVVGFPNGYNQAQIKVAEAVDAINHGATEIDMVINIGKVKERDYHALLQEIRMLREATEGHILKVIIETALLTDDEKKKMCEVVNNSGADYIKTSTGFASGGATFDDVALLRKYSATHVKVKAAGGINSLEDAIKFIELGAERLGTSRIIKLVQGMDSDKISY
jgi:deoxyribose-phosphate aldolase